MSKLIKLEYLNAENSYRDMYMEEYKSLEEGIFNEIKSRIKEDDSSVPYLDNGYYYYTRYEKGKQYPIYCRKKEKLSSPEEILLNVNEMSEGHEYFRVGGIDVSPNNKIMAYFDEYCNNLWSFIFITIKYIYLDF